MIDLDYTKALMLAEINASEKILSNCLSDPADPLFTSLEEAGLVVCGQTPDDLLPGLSGALAKRFADVPREQLLRDLIHPMKKGLGNAYKWGNQKNPAKRITAETVATRTGALIAISDEGEGFEVKSILRQFRGGEDYFTHGGSGFVYFNRAKSIISYTNGGRTLLIRFLRAQTSGTYPMAEKNSALGMAGDEESMKSILTAELPDFKKYKASMDLQGYLERVYDFEEAAKVMKMAAAELRALHHSKIALGIDELVVDALERHRSIAERAISEFAQASPPLAERARQILDRVMARAAALKSCEQVPTHGALGWSSILCSEGRFYFGHSDGYRRSHPGFDLGGFLADLLRFYVLRKKADPEFYFAGREVFLETYFAGAPAPWREDLSFFMADALLLRLPTVLEQVGKKWETGVAALLTRCDQAL